jgi:undecaprenyl-diphosphatase
MGISSPGLTLEIFLHLGTMISIIAVFRADIWRLILGTVVGTKQLPGRGFRSVYRQNDGFRLFGLLVAASLPAAVVGFTLANIVENAFNSPALVSLMLIVTGCVLISSKFVAGKTADNNPWRSLLIGIAQACALIPGISRSGATIVAAMHLGLSPREAGRFSFILALPAIFGASLVEFGSVVSGGTPIALWPVAAGTVTAFVSGYLAIRWVMRLLDGRGFPYFAVYLWSAGLLGVILTV